VLRSSLPISSQSSDGDAVGIRLTDFRVRLVTVGVVAAMAIGVSGCGVAKAEPEAAAKAVQLEVSTPEFSRQRQVSGDEVTLSMTVKNTGSNPAPGLIVQLKGLGSTTIADPLDEGRDRSTKDDLPDSTKRAAWFVDKGPDGAALSSSFLFPGGALAPGRSRTLRWQMNAQTPGDHTLAYQVWSGLTDNEAKATSGTGLSGSIDATILDAAAAS
jgi:hypothetical protein